ncbi:MAG: ROK family transcriptional regulator [Gaiella sp.]
MTNHITAGSPRLLRRLNAAAVLQAIRAGGPISRAELARTTGLSKPTVNSAVELLLEAGYLTERLAGVGADTRRPGPRARLLTFRSDLGHVVGIDIGANKVLVVIVDLAGEVLASVRRRTGPLERMGADPLVDLVIAVADEAIESTGIDRGNLRAVGVGTPGVVDPETGRVTLAPQLGGWEGIHLAGRLEPSFPCPVLVDNEVHLSVLAERWRGSAQEIDDALYVQIGVGIGGGILVGGGLYRGAGGAAGEIGYLPLFDDETGRDGLGPFEHAAGGTAFARLGRTAAETGESPLLLELAGGDAEAIDAELVFTAAARGDTAAQRIVDELLGRLARGIAAAVTILNPSTVIVGGGVSRAGARLLEPLAERIAELVPMPPRVVLSTLGDESAALGAARLALQDVEGRLFDVSLSEAV